MSGFRRPRGVRLERRLAFVGRGTVEAKLFDLGEYPAAVRTAGSRVRGEVYRMLDVRSVLRVIDAYEGYRARSPHDGLYARWKVPVVLDSGESLLAWVYFFNAPLGRARRIVSGNYASHALKKRARVPSSQPRRWPHTVVSRALDSSLEGAAERRSAAPRVRSVHPPG